MSNVDWHSVNKNINAAVAAIIADAEAGHYDMAPQIEPQPPESTIPPTVEPPFTPAPNENPFGSASGIPATDNPYVSPQFVPPASVQEVSESVSANGNNSPEGKGLRIVVAALTQQGKPYRLGANGPEAWDCSSLAQYAYRTALGIELPRTTYDQVKEGRIVKFSESIDGDLIFSNFDADGNPQHVSINMTGPDNVFEAGDPVGIYKWGNRGRVIIKRYT